MLIANKDTAKRYAEKGTGVEQSAERRMADSVEAEGISRRLIWWLSMEWICWCVVVFLAINDEPKGAAIALAAGLVAKLGVCRYVVKWAHLTGRNGGIYGAGTLLIKFFGDPLIPLCALYSLRKLRVAASAASIN